MAASFKTSKNVILPSLDKIKDPEVKRVLEQTHKAIQEMNGNSYNDISALIEAFYFLIAFLGA